MAVNKAAVAICILIVLGAAAVGMYFWLRPKKHTTPDGLSAYADCGNPSRKCGCGTVWNGASCDPVSGRSCTFDLDCPTDAPVCVNGTCVTADRLLPAGTQTADISGRCALDTQLIADDTDAFLAGKASGKCVALSGECGLSADCAGGAVCALDRERQIVRCLDPSTVPCNPSGNGEECYAALSADVPMTCTSNGVCARGEQSSATGGTGCMSYCRLPRDENGKFIPGQAQGCGQVGQYQLTCADIGDEVLGRCYCPSDPLSGSAGDCVANYCVGYTPNLCGVPSGTGEAVLRCEPGAADPSKQCRETIETYTRNKPGLLIAQDAARELAQDRSTSIACQDDTCSCRIPCTAQSVCPVAGFTCESGFCGTPAKRFWYLPGADCFGDSSCNQLAEAHGDLGDETCTQEKLKKLIEAGKPGCIPSMYSRCITNPDLLGPYADVVDKGRLVTGEQGVCSPPMWQSKSTSFTVLGTGTTKPFVGLLLASTVIVLENDLITNPEGYIDDVANVTDARADKVLEKYIKSVFPSNETPYVCPSPWTNGGFLYEHKTKTSGSVFHSKHEKFNTWFCDLLPSGAL